MNAITHTPQSQIDEIIAFWEEKAKGLPEPTYRTYMQSIKVLAMQIIQDLGKLSCTSPERLMQQTNHSILELKTTASHLFETHRIALEKLHGQITTFQTISSPDPNTAIPSITISSTSPPSGISPALLSKWGQPSKPTAAFQAISLSMDAINTVAAPIHWAESVVSAAIAKGCQTAVTEPICQVVAQGTSSIGQAIAEAIPESVAQTAQKTVQYLEKNGIPRQKTLETVHSALSIATVAPMIPSVARFSKAAIKPKTAPISTLSTVEQSTLPTDMGRPSLREVKKKFKHQDYVHGLQLEQMLMKVLQKARSSHLPKDFPENINQFFANCEAHSFKAKNLGHNGKGLLEGHLLFQPVGKSEAIFTITTHTSSPLIREKATWKLIRSAHLDWDARLNEMLNIITNLSKERGFESIYLAWNPEKMALATILATRSETALGMASLSTGLSSKPFAVIKLPMKK